MITQIPYSSLEKGLTEFAVKYLDGKGTRTLPDLTYPGCIDQGAGVEIKPLRHDGNATQGAGPLVPERCRKVTFKERQGDEEEVVFRENPTTEDETEDNGESKRRTNLAEGRQRQWRKRWESEMDNREYK
ncbi:hypothetical protein NDU88_002361 [Pleurodeles waltl]|uniref:Uncharacterized protein n=1 Tax=Pleurodeles waltl TaxID=8319 RepID=A0AAV7SAQ4_PLEWA|nr:hypothetical protein NDU88_002361 [Pleurodeles waltl]